MTTESMYATERMGDWGVPFSERPDGYQSGFVSTPDGVKLFYRQWQAEETAPTLVLLHGLGAHTGWFIDMGAALHARGLSVFAMDHRGFGRSEGPRGHVRRGDVYLRDITHILRQRRQASPQSPLFILGHSMGAIFALHVGAEDAKRPDPLLSGVTLMNPWIADHAAVSPMAVAGLLLTGMMGSSKPFHAEGGPETMTKNPEAVRMLNADKYWVREESASFLYQITLMRMATKARAQQVRAPSLVIQCEQDLAVVPAASRRIYEALGSSDKTWKTYPDFAHDCEFEPGRSILDDDLAQWIKAHVV